MKILFRTSGGRTYKKELGFGHIYRCINLSRQLTSHEIIFLIEDYGSVSSVLKENNFKTIKLKPGISESLDIKKTVNFVKKNQIDIVVVDRYGLTNRYIKALKEITKVVVISDLRNIQYDANIIVNGFIGYKNKIIQNKYGIKCLLGPKYQLLDHRYLNNKFSYEKKSDILDLGCGTGFVGLSISKNSRLKNNYYFSDISSKAMKLCKKNAKKNNPINIQHPIYEHHLQKRLASSGPSGCASGRGQST